MAEFQEVCRQALRMSRATESSVTHVALYITDKGTVSGDFGREAVDPAVLEESIMKWAAENPEPVYPSWNDAWRQLFPDAYCVNSPCPNHFLQKERSMPCDYRVCTDCKSQPIPADIANKLGIEPINQ